MQKLELSPASDAALAVLDALYRAEQAAEDAATASVTLQQAVRRAERSGAFTDMDTNVDSDFIGDADTVPTVITSVFDDDAVKEEEDQERLEEPVSQSINEPDCPEEQ